MDLKLKYAEKLIKVLQEPLSISDVYNLIETPKHPAHGDLAFPCFYLAKKIRKSPNMLAGQIAETLVDPLFTKVGAKGAYVNVFFSKMHIGTAVVTDIMKKKSHYGNSAIGANKTVVLDLSSPNIAKPFSMGHLRSTVIGNALANIAEKCGYKVVRINHVGDWGTQFGKLIIAYEKWGDFEKVKENPIQELFKLYITFHDEAEKTPSLEEEARSAFKLLEEGHQRYTELWEWFRSASLQMFLNIYQLLDIKFDSYHGEAFYNDKMEPVVNLLKEQHLLEESDGAEVVRLDDISLPPCLIKKKDGATLYATRDLAAALYRQQTYQFDEALYIVGQEQSIHFQQVFAVLQKLGYEWAHHMKHIPFGLYLMNGKKMSSRKGHVVLLEEVLYEAIALAEKNITDRNPDIPNKAEIAKAVGVGAIIFHDVKNERMNSISFSLQDMLTFEGDTGPYIQYTFARAQSILRKGKETNYTFTGLDTEESWEVIKLLQIFPKIVEKAYEQFAPSVIAKYLLDLAKAFNQYYGKVKILHIDDDLHNRLSLVNAVAIVLAEGLSLLGIKAPKKM